MLMDIHLSTQAILLVWCMVAIPSAIVKWRRSTEANKRINIGNPWALLKRRVKAWSYLLWGPEIIQQEYAKADNKPFEVLAPDNRYVFVSSPKHIKELDSAPDTVLSLQAASKQMLQPRYTMHGFNWFDRRGTEGVGFIRALRTLLTNNMPSIIPKLRTEIENNFNNSYKKHEVRDGVKHSPVYPMIVELTVLTNALAFFGDDLASNPDFMKSALSYIEDTLKTAEVVRLLPGFISPLIGNLLAMRLSSHATIYEALVPIAEQRLREKSLKNLGHSVPEHRDCIQWIMETSPKQAWTAKRIVHELMAIWFGSVHALSTTISFAIHDLCLHPEYIEPLRAELDMDGEAYAEFEKTAQGLPLLDSFIKESARLTPVESMSTRRHALQPFTLSDGTKVGVGDWACTPVRAIMQNPTDYPNPLEFNGFRFVDTKLVDGEILEKFKIPQPSPSKMTDTGASWHVWGTGRMACPGRYYATSVMKIMLAQVIRNYDCELVDKNASRWWTWRSSMLPNPKTMVIFRPRSIPN